MQVGFFNPFIHVCRSFDRGVFILEVDCFSASSKMMFVIMFVGYERDEGLDVNLVVMLWPSPAAHGVI